MQTNHIYHGHCLDILKTLPENSIDCCVTSPPYYGLRDYGVHGQIGLEETPEMFVQQLVQVFNEVNRVLKPTGTLWLNIGDSYAGSGKGGSEYAESKTNWKQGTNKGSHTKGNGTYKAKNVKPKDLIGIPWMLAFALRNAGWYLRQEIIWHKPNPMPESVTDRCTKAHEQIFLLTKRAQYYFDAEAIKTDSIDPDDDRGSRGNQKRKPTQEISAIRNSGVYPKANKRSVWTVTTSPYKDAHFATFPENLIVDCIKAGCPINGIVLDPFSGAGTTAVVAKKLQRQYIGIELNQKYINLTHKRLHKELGIFQ